MVKKLAIIEVCEKCPHFGNKHEFSYGMGQQLVEYCFKSERKIKTIKTIPDWCELSNLPRVRWAKPKVILDD